MLFCPIYYRPIEIDSEWQCSVLHAQRPLPGRTIHNGWHALIVDNDFTDIMSVQCGPCLSHIERAQHAHFYAPTKTSNKEFWL